VRLLDFHVKQAPKEHTLGARRAISGMYEQLDKIRSRRDRYQKESRRSMHLSRVYRRVSEQKREVAP
jgi:hypothetical protein